MEPLRQNTRRLGTERYHDEESEIDDRQALDSSRSSLDDRLDSTAHLIDGNEDGYGDYGNDAGQERYNPRYPDLGPRSYWRILMDGPEVPKEPHVTMIFPKLQTYPNTIAKMFPTFVKRTILVVYLFMWSLIFMVLANESILSSPMIGDEHADLLRCSAVPQVWYGKNDWCGLNGEDCYGSNTGKVFRFKCPADCIKESWTYSETPVGGYESVYRPYVIGGNNTYRADSYVCGAAVHRGIVSNRAGGCGMIRFTGPKLNGFISEKSHGIESIGTEAEFPASYEFLDTSGLSLSGCYDLRVIIISVNIILSLIFGYFVSHPGLFLYGLTIAGFWTVILASNPPLAGGEELADAELISLGFRRLLPALLSTYVIYGFSTKPQLKDLEANFSRMVFWVSGFWIAILENYVFAALPLDRLTPHDLNAQPGAWLALIILVSVVLSIAIGQAYVIWRLGKFKPYIQYYLLVIALLIALSFVPNQTLRMHHYIWTLILLPGTGFKTTPSLFYQGLLVGLFVSGVARWDFDSILQTYEQLRRGAPTFKGGFAKFGEPAIIEGGGVLKNITLLWQSLSDARQSDESIDTAWDGYSLIINDVERYRGRNNSFNITDWAIQSFGNLTESIALTYYVRVAFAEIVGSRTGDYTRAGKIVLNTGEWKVPPPGAI
ncbi:hypothetical protein AWJ20_1615 [Sugiyamaella lignohabitans]|uniref:LCCL domain-containing protein n=1 Tax=Sugiyamaella lignohabitans TaxID=796027 RepID=A0A167DV55_9ASCO|nr:uncharacterized protein AWJ20_1615 [Sugiyamaella lignohabitans]ANB13329.1 hypothetical protein AWJ20_1615 [Sugiyamaella lignohabitans]